MRLDAREDQGLELEELKWDGKLFDKDTGKEILLVVAVDDSIGQVIRYPENFKDYGNVNNIPLISEIRNIEIVDTRL